jgi:rod shape-determining protein MreC
VLLERELGYKQTINLKMIPTQIISHNLSSWFDTATIDEGKNLGIEKGCAVVNHLGLIGQVVSIGNKTSQIVSLNDPNSAVGGMVQRSRAKGIIQGQWTEYLVFAYLKKDADVNKDDIVVSSGDGQVIPKGIVIGRVEKVIRDNITGTTNAFVKPSVRFDEIEYVFVVISK